MKDLKKTFAQQFTLSAAGSAATLCFMTVPLLEGARTQAAQAIGATPSLLWVPAGILIIGLQYLSFHRSNKLVASPFHKLMREAEHGEQGFAFKTRAKTKEEDGIKHAIEAANLKAREASDQAEDLEAELERTASALSEEKAKSAALQARYDEIDAATRDIRVENETLKASKTALELTLETERKSKVGAEVEKRAEEIYTQMERAVSAAAIKAVWIPSLVHELKTPISIINELSGKLSSSWKESSITEVEKEIGTILAQSQAQLELLNEILDRQPPVEKPEPPALILEPESEDPKPGPEQEVTAPEQTLSEPQAVFDITNDIEIDEPETVREPAPMGLEPKTETSPPTPEKPHALETILGNLVDEFSAKYVDIHYSFSLDKDLEIELEDPVMLNLLRTLAESASHATLEGEVVLGVELQPENLIFDVVCNGELNPQIDPVLISRAEREALSLGGQIEIESTSPTELHLSFTYPLGAPSEQTIQVE